MTTKIPPIGILQGRLTPSPDGSIQFFPKDNWQNEFALAKGIGFDCMELLVKKDSGPENPILSSAGIAKIEKLSQNHGISIFSVHGFYNKSDDFDMSLGKIVYGSSVLGINTVLVSFFDENSLRTDHDKDLAIKQLSSPAWYAGVIGVRLAVETEMPALELKDFVLSFKNPYIGVYYDIGNMASMGVNVVDEIHILDKLILGVHVKDRLANGGKTVPLGEGCVKFKEAFTALREVGYKGPFIIQGARSENISDISLNKKYHDFCRNILAEVYEKGGR